MKRAIANVFCTLFIFTILMAVTYQYLHPTPNTIDREQHTIAYIIMAAFLLISMIAIKKIP